jgi:hypothetical protein
MHRHHSEAAAVLLLFPLDDGIDRPSVVLDHFLEFLLFPGLGEVARVVLLFF